MGEISVEEKDNTVIVSISGEISMTTVNNIDNSCRKYINSNLKVLALNFKNVTFIDSFGISRIIKQSRIFSGNGTDFVLIDLNDNITQIFKIATFDKLFTIMKKEDFTGKYLNS